MEGQLGGCVFSALRVRSCEGGLRVEDQLGNFVLSCRVV